MKKLTRKNLMQTILEFGLSIRKDRIRKTEDGELRSDFGLPTSDFRHAIQVCRLACCLFDELQSLHRMGNTERIWLQIAALLHDVAVQSSRRDAEALRIRQGDFEEDPQTPCVSAPLRDKMIGGNDHNEKSRDIIIKSAKLPLARNERIIVGLVVRYHRGALPSRSHRYYGQLDAESRYYVRRLAALLRFADGLDQDHQCSVTDLSCHVTEDNIIVCPQTRGAFDPRKAIAKADLLEEVLGRAVIISQLAPSLLSAEIESPDDWDYTDLQY